MQRAMSCLKPWDHALIDGRGTKKHDLGEHTAIIKGDLKSYSIACASIVAKVVRDRLMQRLAKNILDMVGNTTRDMARAFILKAWKNTASPAGTDVALLR